MIGLLLTLLTGIFFLLGIVVHKLFKDKEKITVLAIAMALVILLNLIIGELLPEVIDFFSWPCLIFIIAGLFLLKIFDLFVPHHHHEHKELDDDEDEHNNHLEHISIITIFALCLHNILECMVLYNLTIESVKSGVLMALGVALHNIPLGLQIGSHLNKHKFIYILILVLSGLVGGIISLSIGSVPEVIESYILSFTLGMLIYLTLFELSKELWASRKNIYSLYGIIIGIIFVVISGLL